MEIESSRDRYYRLYTEHLAQAEDEDYSPTKRIMHTGLADLYYRLFKEAMVF